MSPRFSDARGNALIATLAILFGLTIVTTTYLLLATTETQISGHDSRAQQALYVAEAGVGEALGRLTWVAGTASIVESGAPTPGWGRYIVVESGGSAADPARAAQGADGLDNDADGQVDEPGEVWPEVVTVQAGTPLPYTWVRIRYKLNSLGQILRYGDHDDNPSTPDIENTSVGAPEYLITAAGRHGPAQRVVEVVAPHLPFPPIPAALYTETTDITFNGTQFEVCGFDTDPATGDSIPGAPPIAGIATTGDPSLITDDFHPQQQNNVIGEGGSPSVLHSPYDFDMQAYFNAYAPFADIVYTSTVSNPNTTGWGGLDSYHIVLVQGDLHLSGGNTGGGILLVQGSLDVSGQFTWYGAIVCLGSVVFTGGGTGAHVYGAMMAGNGVSTSETYSGNADVFYSSETLGRLNFAGPYRIAAWKEI